MNHSYYTIALFIEAFRPLEETARASVHTSGKHRDKSILPLISYQNVHLKVNAMREYDFLSVSWS